MCGIVGIVNYHEDISNHYAVLRNMNATLKKRGPDEEGMFFEKHVNLAHRRLIVIDPDGGKQPMHFTWEGVDYSIVYNGQIYNTKELKETLIENGFTFRTRSDTEVLLKAYIYYKEDVCQQLNGIFALAIWNNQTEELFLARDHFGIKPLYFTTAGNNFIFASEVKAIIEHPDVEPILDHRGICELFGVGPSHSPGCCPFKDIHELKPAHFMIRRKNCVIEKEYWKLISKPHTDDFDTTCKHVYDLLEDSIERQLLSDVPLCTLLSGGLDSSLITAFACRYYQKHQLGKLNTYSVDYKDNDIHFKANDFQPNSDNFYIDLMVKEFDTVHHKIILDTPELAKSLEDAMCARDFPGMADVDSSILLFLREVKKHATVALSGECSDEIFAGYPWYFREDALKSNTFPWSLAITERQHLLSPAIGEKINLKEYIDEQYQNSLANVIKIPEESEENFKKRKIAYLNLNWFMQTLLDRTDRMAMYNGFEVRVPFCDYRIVEYLWNVPWEMKAYQGREKGLLRHVAEKILPKEIVYRKKSPYPKTHNPTYLLAVKNQLSKIMENKDAPIKTLLNENYIREILETDGSAFSRPWFGQLMTGPQLMAYLCQVNMWLERYQPKIEIEK